MFGESQRRTKKQEEGGTRHEKGGEHGEIERGREKSRERKDLEGMRGEKGLRQRVREIERD